MSNPNAERIETVTEQVIMGRTYKLVKATDGDTRCIFCHLFGINPRLCARHCAGEGYHWKEVPREKQTEGNE